MKYTDFVAMGAAFSASQMASEAFDEIERLQIQIDQLRLNALVDVQDRDFQKWIEEMLYQFVKITWRISNEPRDPFEDFREIGAYLKLIYEKQINTTVISGLENKKIFEETLARAELLFGDLWKNPEVVKQGNLWMKRDAEERNRLAVERAEIIKREAEKKDSTLREKRLKMGTVTGILGIGILLALAGKMVESDTAHILPWIFIAWLVYWVISDKILRRRLEFEFNEQTGTRDT